MDTNQPMDLEPLEAQRAAASVPEDADTHTLETALQTGIFKATAFPQVTQPVKFTPQNLAAAMLNYATTTTSWADICDKQGLRESGTYEQMERYPELRVAFSLARARKSQVVLESQYRLHQDKPPDDAYMVDSHGVTRLDPAWTGWARDRAAILARVAGNYETGSAVVQRQSTHRVMSVSLNLSQQDAPAEQQVIDQLDVLLSPPQQE